MIKKIIKVLNYEFFLFLLISKKFLFFILSILIIGMIMDIELLIVWIFYFCRIILEVFFSFFDKIFVDNFGSVLILVVIVSLILDIFFRFKCKRNFDIEYIYFNKSDIYIVICLWVYRLSNCCN